MAASSPSPRARSGSRRRRSAPLLAIDCGPRTRRPCSGAAPSWSRTGGFRNRLERQHALADASRALPCISADVLGRRPVCLRDPRGTAREKRAPEPARLHPPRPGSASGRAADHFERVAAAQLARLASRSLIPSPRWRDASGPALKTQAPSLDTGCGPTRDPPASNDGSPTRAVLDLNANQPDTVSATGVRPATLLPNG